MIVPSDGPSEPAVGEIPYKFQFKLFENSEKHYYFEKLYNYIYIRVYIIY